MRTKIFDYGMNGEGVGKINEKVCLVEKTLIDEDVEIEVLKDYGNYLAARANKILTQSQNRTTPPCKYYNTCGGCNLQHMKYEEQLKFKTLLIQKTIKKISKLDVKVNDCIASSLCFGYRNKFSFNFKNLKSGLYEENSHNIVEVQSCPLTTDNINKIYSLFTNFVKANNLLTIKHLVVREIEGQILIGVVSKIEINLLEFYKTLENHFTNFGLYAIINTRNDQVVLSGKVKHIGGIKNIIINNFGLLYNVDLIGFHQININIQNKLYNKVLQFINDTDTVINGFSGQGLLSAIVASKAKKVIGIEIVKNSHQSAENLKKQNKISNLTNICADFNKEISKHINTANTIILDPSKKGVDKKALQSINGIENIIYISCNPIALAKDLRVLTDYEIEEIIPFDMFPNTNNVETLVKLKFKEKL